MQSSLVWIVVEEMRGLDLLTMVLGCLPILKPVLKHVLPACMVPSSHDNGYTLSDSTRPLPNYRPRRGDEEANDASIANLSRLEYGKARSQELEYGRQERLHDPNVW